MNRTTIFAIGLAIYCGAWFTPVNVQAQQLVMPRIGGYSAAAQPAPTTSPAVSPYLLLTDVGQSGLLNYQTLVQPQLQQRAVSAQQNTSIQRLQQQVRRSSQKGANETARETGHPTRNFNYSHYYNSANPY